MSALVLMAAEAGGSDFALPGIWNLTPWGAFIGMCVYTFFSYSRGWVYSYRQHSEVLKFYIDNNAKLEVANAELLEANSKLIATNGELVDTISILNPFFKEVFPSKDSLEVAK